MYVSKLVVRGYRSLADVEINFNPGINVIVGKNNAGKSNIIRALNLILGEKHPSYRELENRDFHNDGSNSADELIIAARLDGELHLDIDLNWRIRVSELGSEFTPDWDESCIETLQDETSSGRSMPSVSVIESIRSSNERWIFLHAKKDASGNLFGLAYRKNGTWYRISLRDDLRKSLITTAYIPSYRDPEKMLRVTEYSWYGKLIEKIYHEGLETHEQEIRKIQKQYSDKIGEIFYDATQELRERLKKAVFHHRISFKPGPYTKDDDYKSITLFVDDGLDTPYYDKGSGIQSALIIALFTYYCDRFHRGSSLLLLEEPENYLHPQGRRALEGELLRFVEECSDGERQVILSTHSPEFLRSVELKSLIRIHKKPGSTASEICQINEEELDVETKRKFKQIMMQKGVEMFFADGAILVEGGEEYLLPQLFDIFANERRWLDSRNISVVRVDGKMNFKNYTNILDKIGIWWVILTDLDFLYNGINRFEHLLDEDDIELINRIASEADKYAEEQTKEISNPRQKREERRMKRMEKLKLFVKEQDVKTLLRRLRENGVFILSKGELEDYFTERTMQLENSKDRRALELALILSEIEEESKLSEWFVDIDEFKNLFEVVKSKIVLSIILELLYR